MGGEQNRFDSPEVNNIEAAVAAGNSAAVASLLERRQKECERLTEELRKRETEYGALADNSSDGIVRFDRDYQVIYANPAASRMMHSPRKELLGKSPSEFTMPLHLASLWQGGVQRVLEKGRENTFEYEFDDQRTVHYLRITMIPEFDPDGAVESVLAITRDISEQKKTVVALRESEERFRLALGASPTIVYAQDGSLRYTWVYSSHPDFDAGKFLGRTDRDMYPADPAERLATLKRRVLETGRNERAELEVATPQGNIWLDVTIAPLRNNEGQTIGITGASLDITGRKEAEAALHGAYADLKAQSALRQEVNEALVLSSVRKHELAEMTEKLTTRLQLLLDTLPVAVIIAEDPEGRSVTMNPDGFRMFEVSEGENVSVAALSAHRYFHQGRVLTPEEMPLQMAISGNQAVQNMEIDVYLSGGRHWTGVFNAAPLHNREETVIGGIAVALDITERKQAEEKVKEAKSKMETTLNALPDLLFEVDREGRIYHSHVPDPEKLHIPKREFHGSLARDVLPPDVAGIISEAITQAAKEGRLSGSVYPLELSGEKNWFELSVAAEGDHTKPDARFVVLARDVSERHRLEENVQRLRREQEAFLRHEVKNLFAPIQLFAELTLDSENLTEEQIHYLQRIEETATRAAGFVDSLKRIQDIETGIYTLRLVRQPLDTIIRMVVQNLEPLAKKSGVTVEFRATGKEALIPLDSQLLPGVFSNLIQNAIEHVAKLQNPAEKVVTVELRKEQGWYIVRIHNRGVPIPSERLATFFEKFNTGPEKKGGTGLGTTYAYFVTKAHGGDISVTSNDVEGTTVTVMFPAELESPK